MRRQIGAGVCLLGLSFGAVVQAAGDQCKSLTYESHNQIDYGPIIVNSIRGVAQDAQGVPIPKACVGVFTETEHKLLAVAETDDGGRFELTVIPRGEYRLVAKYEGFCPVNAKLRIGRRSKDKKPLMLQMRPAGLDSCSYVEAK